MKRTLGILGLLTGIVLVLPGCKTWQDSESEPDIFRLGLKINQSEKIEEYQQAKQLFLSPTDNYDQYYVRKNSLANKIIALFMSLEKGPVLIKEESTSVVHMLSADLPEIFAAHSEKKQMDTISLLETVRPSLRGLINREPYQKKTYKRLYQNHVELKFVDLLKQFDLIEYRNGFVDQTIDWYLSEQGHPQSLLQRMQAFPKYTIRFTEKNQLVFDFGIGLVDSTHIKAYNDAVQNFLRQSKQEQSSAKTLSFRGPGGPKKWYLTLDRKQHKMFVLYSYQQLPPNDFAATLQDSMQNLLETPLRLLNEEERDILLQDIKEETTANASIAFELSVTAARKAKKIDSLKNLFQMTTLERQGGL